MVSSQHSTAQHSIAVHTTGQQPSNREQWSFCASIWRSISINHFFKSFYLKLMKQRTGTARSSASEGYLMEKYTDLWHHIQKYKVHNFDEGLEHLRSVSLKDHWKAVLSINFLIKPKHTRKGHLDVLIGDTAILDYFRATDPGCILKLLGDSIFDDAYAVGMQKGFPFRVSHSFTAAIASSFACLEWTHVLLLSHHYHL